MESKAVLDSQYWEEIQKLNLSVEELIVNFPSFIRHYEMTKFIAHYELFKKVVDLPGCIVELGIFKGASFFTWVKFLEAFCPGDITRKVYGFDWFHGLQNFCEKDGKQDERADKKVEGAYASDPSLIHHLVNLQTLTGIRVGVQRGYVIEGDVRDTIPKFLEEIPGLRISLLYLDMDLYEPTQIALEKLYPLVVSGGVIALDQYGQIPWQGETVAAEEYFESKLGYMPIVKKFPFSVSPHAYFIKNSS
jgi:hypothetical protein